MPSLLFSPPYFIISFPFLLKQIGSHVNVLAAMQLVNKVRRAFFVTSYIMIGMENIKI